MAAGSAIKSETLGNTSKNVALLLLGIKLMFVTSI